ncbi:MAG: VanZ family protein [Flavobacterium sp.]|nr:VanZ family protein [Flavobacterium sp.]
MKSTLKLSERSYLIIAIAWTLLLTYLCLTSIKKEPFLPSITNKDKIVHFLFYFIFVLFWSRAFKSISLRKLLVIVLIAIVYGIIIEVLQSMFTVSREADVYDVLANAIGALTAFIFLQFYKN